jgi:selenocysteine lyase/cysteine desulfurase
MQMATIPIPGDDAGMIKERLWNDFKVEIPIMGRADGVYARISIQAYNGRADVDRLVEAITALT